MERHAQEVQRIAARVREFHDQKLPFKIYHGSTNSTRKCSMRRDRSISTCNLCNVLQINTRNRTALVEPNVSMDKLVQATLKYGFLPPVVPEFPGITLGGGVSGIAGESSSFRYGFLDETANWVEVVLPTGEVTKVSNERDQELFCGLAGTMGTLAIATLFEIRLIEAKPYLELTYYPVNSVPEVIWRTQKATDDPANDYVDAILYSKSRGVVIVGRFADTVKPGLELQHHYRAQDEWYYLHVRNLLENAETPKVEVVPIVDYLFRYDRGAFWTGRYVFTYFAVPFLFFFRWLLDPLMRTKVLYHGLHENGMARDNIIQDVTLPISKVRDFVYWTDQHLGVYPLWLCPFRKRSQGRMFFQPRHLQELRGDQQLLNVGLWGPRLPDPSNFVAENRRLERKVEELGGMKWLYAHCHYSETDFWRVYDKPWYDALRTKYSADYLPSVYEKTKFDWSAEERAIQGSWLRWLFSFVWWIWPMPGIYGIICVLRQSDYLMSTSGHKRHRVGTGKAATGGDSSEHNSKDRT